MTRENEGTKTREDKGAAGSPRTVSQCGHSEPGTASGTGHDKNKEPKRERRHVPEEPARRQEPQPPRQPAPARAPKPVERVTALRGQAIARPPAAQTPAGSLQARSCSPILISRTGILGRRFAGSSARLLSGRTGQPKPCSSVSMTCSTAWMMLNTTGARPAAKDKPTGNRTG
jgi:hypothetical protein